MAKDDNNNNTNNNNFEVDSSDVDHLYKVSPEDKQAGLRAIEPLPSSLNLVIASYDKAPIKGDLSEKEWAAKLKTEANDWGICDEAMTAAKKILKDMRRC